MKKVVIVGVGALGSHLAMLLRNEQAELTLIDMDRIEAKNILSQLHSKPSVGKNKAEALKQTMQFLFGAKVTAVPHRLTKDNLDLLKADLVVDAVDNGVTRRLIQGYVRQHNISCLHGALAADGAFGQSMWDQSFAIDDEAGAGAATCANGEHLPFIALTSAYLARSVQIFLATGKQVSFAISPAGAFCV